MGKSDPSEVISAKTQGSSPVAPKRDAVLSVNGAALTVNLNSWNAAGCPILSFTVQYRVQEEGHDWILISDSIPAEQKTLVVPDLVPGKWYTLRVAAHSEAGTTEHDYTFSTLTKAGASIPPLNSLEGRKPAFYKSVGIMVPIVCVVAIVVLIVAILSYVIPRRRRQATPNHFIDSCSEDKNLEAMSLSILKQTGSSLETASPNKEQLYYPSPYAMGRIQALGKQGGGGGSSESEAAAAMQTLKRVTRREHIYEVPYPRWTEEDNYSHMRDGGGAPVSNIYQTPRKTGLTTRANSDAAAQLAIEEQRLSRESRNHRMSFKSSSLACADNHSADDSDSEGAAYTFRLTMNGSYGDHQEMSEAECDRDQHTRAKRLEALGIHVSPSYGIT